MCKHIHGHCFFKLEKVQLANILCISETAVENNLKYLKDNGYIKRNGSNKTGYWEVIR